MRNKCLLLALVFALVACHSESSESFLKSGMTKYDRHDYRRALVDYNKAIKLDSNNLKAYLRRGDARVKLQLFVGSCKCAMPRDSDFENIMSDFKKAAKLDSNCLEAYVKMAIEQTFWDDRQSLKYFQKALAIGSKSDSVYLLIGKSAAKITPRSSEALYAFNMAIKLNPNNSEAYKGRGDLLRSFPNEKKAA